MPYAVTRCRAVIAPSVPVPPVISTVPSVSSGRGCGPASDGDRSCATGTRTSRGASATPSRTLSCGSPLSTTAARADRETSSRSARTIRSGCSDCAERTRPHTAAASGSAQSPVTTASRVSARAGSASQAWSTASAALTDARGSAVALTASGSASYSRTSGTDVAEPAEAATSSPVATVTMSRERSWAGSAHSVHSTRNRASCGNAPTIPACSGENGVARTTSTVMTGCPVGSVSRRPVPSVDVPPGRTCRAAAPEASRDTPVHTDGSMPSGTTVRTAASSSAGCTP